MTELKTKRLLLRPIEPGDYLEIAGHINNLRVSQNLTRVPYPYTLDDIYRWQGADNRGSHIFAITFKGEAIGVIGLESELGYWLAEAFWKQGFMGEAARAATDFAFGRAGYDRLVSGYKHGNEASRRILIGLGFRHTGHKRVHSCALKRPVRVATVELTRSEWLRERARK